MKNRKDSSFLYQDNVRINGCFLSYRIEKLVISNYNKLIKAIKTKPAKSKGTGDMRMNPSFGIAGTDFRWFLYVASQARKAESRLTL